MKLYTFPMAPNPTKLEFFLREKGIELPRVIVNLIEGEQKKPEHLARNPLGKVPVLELEDGSYLSESLAIIEYLEELHPEPPMIGRNALERARVRELERMIDAALLGRVSRLVHATRSPLPGVEPNPEAAELERAQLPAALAAVDERIGDSPFAAGDRPTIADGTLFAALRFGGFFGIDFGLGSNPHVAHIHRWYEMLRERPSTH